LCRRRHNHDLRHFYASTLIAANLHPKVIQARLGHASITETMDAYGNSRELHLAGELCPVSRLSRAS
jgi:integrase